MTCNINSISLKPSLSFIWEYVKYNTLTRSVPFCCLYDLIQIKKEKNELLTVNRKSDLFLFPLYPDETQISVKPDKTIKKQHDKYIPFLNNWNLCL